MLMLLSHRNNRNQFNVTVKTVKGAMPYLEQGHNCMDFLWIDSPKKYRGIGFASIDRFIQ